MNKMKVCDILKSIRQKEYQFYNENIKYHFLQETYDNKEDNINTVGFYARILERIGSREKKLNKDLYQFTYSEIITFLRSLNYKSRDTLNGVLSIIVGYTDFCLKHNYKSKGELNIARFNISSKDLDELVDAMNQKWRFIYSHYELEELIKKYAVNAQDAVIYALIFEGLKGDDFSEVRNLKKSDVNIDNHTIRLNRDFTIYNTDGKIIGKENKEIDIEVSDFTMDIILDAIDQTDYMTVNLKSTDLKRTNKYEAKTLSDTDYVLRVSGTTKPNKPVGKAVLNRRTKQVAELAEKPSITPTTIHFSGASSYVNALLEDYKLDQPTTEIFKEACLRYGLTPEYTWHRLKRIWTYIQEVDSVGAQ
nr:hypothetical protein [Vallitalea okinawensis]